MYRVLCDGLPIYDLRDENLVLIDPKLDLEVNKAGSFSFKMPPQHPQYELPKKMLSCIQVFQDDEEVFNGRITECKIDFYNRKYFTCKGVWHSMKMHQFPVDNFIVYYLVDDEKRAVTVARIFYGGRDIEGVINSNK